MSKHRSQTVDASEPAKQPLSWVQRIGIPTATSTVAQIVIGPSLAAKPHMQKSPEKGIGKTIVSIYKTEGLRGLYKGNGYNYLRVWANATINTNVAKELRNNINTLFPEKPLVGSVSAGLATGLFETLMPWGLPIEKRELGKTTQQPWTHPGILRTYSTLGMAIALRNGIGWSGSLTGNLLLQHMERDRELSLLERVSVMTMTGLTTTLLTVPFDANVTRTFLANGEKGAGTVFTDALHEQGLKAVTAGWKARLGTAGPSLIAAASALYIMEHMSQPPLGKWASAEKEKKLSLQKTIEK